MADSQRLTQITLDESKDLLHLAPGEMTCDAARRVWFIGCPQCHGAGSLQNHTVNAANGVITVSPSILCGCGAHYFVESNAIRWV